MANEIQKVAVVKSMAELKGTLEAYSDSLASVCAKTLTPQRVISLLLSCAMRDGRIATCTKSSLLDTCMIASQLGLEFGGPLGQCYPLVYWNGNLQANECKFMIGYRGMIDLSLRSGLVSHVEARLVYSKDRFELHQGTDPKITHEPDVFGDRGVFVGGYGIAWLKDGKPQYDLMSAKQIDGIKQRTKSKDRNGNIVGPWVTDEDEMRRKTLLRRLWKVMPCSIEMRTAIEADDNAGHYMMGELESELDPQLERGKTALQRRLDTARNPKSPETQLPPPNEPLSDDSGNPPPSTSDEQISQLDAAQSSGPTKQEPRIDPSTSQEQQQSESEAKGQKIANLKWLDFQAACVTAMVNAGHDTEPARSAIANWFNHTKMTYPGIKTPDDLKPALKKVLYATCLKGELSPDGKIGAAGQKLEG